MMYSSLSAYDPRGLDQFSKRHPICLLYITGLSYKYISKGKVKFLVYFLC